MVEAPGGQPPIIVHCGQSCRSSSSGSGWGGRPPTIARSALLISALLICPAHLGQQPDREPRPRPSAPPSLPARPGACGDPAQYWRAEGRRSGSTPPRHTARPVQRTGDSAQSTEHDRVQIHDGEGGQGAFRTPLGGNSRSAILDVVGIGAPGIQGRPGTTTLLRCSSASGRTVAVTPTGRIPRAGAAALNHSVNGSPGRRRTRVPDPACWLVGGTR